MRKVVCAWCLSDDVECIDDEHAIYQCRTCGETFSRPEPDVEHLSVCNWTCSQEDSWRG